MKLFSKCPYTLDNRVRTSLHTYSIRNRTAAIQPCRTPHRTQPRTPNPVTSIVHMSRSHLKCHCLGWFLPWMEKNTRRLILILWIIMKNPVCPPCIKLKLYMHKKGHTHKFIYIYILYMYSYDVCQHSTTWDTIHKNINHVLIPYISMSCSKWLWRSSTRRACKKPPEWPTELSVFKNMFIQSNETIWQIKQTLQYLQDISGYRLINFLSSTFSTASMLGYQTHDQLQQLEYVRVSFTYTASCRY